MKTITILKAQAVVDPVESTTIVIDETMPAAGPGTDTGARFTDEAATLADALLKCLPGGTVDALLAELLARTASRLVVPHRQPVAPATGGAT